MTTMTPPTDTPPPPPPGSPPPPEWSAPPPPPPGPPVRRLQRSTSDRVAGGVAGGLGEYFGLDPILFRVLFAVAAFFGGFGVLAYAVLWVALPDAGDPTTPSVDRLGRWLRDRGVPLWVAGIVGVVGFWVLVGGFSGFGAHGLFFPGAAVVGVVLLVVALSRRGRPTPVAGAAAPWSSTVPPTGPATDPGAAAAPRPMTTWYHEAREAGRRRRRRSRPVRIATGVTLLAALATVAVVDAVSGVALPVYAVVVGTVVLVGVVVAAVIRRPAYAMSWLLVPVLGWLLAFGGTHVSFRDGAADRFVRPTSIGAVQPDYRLAFGRLTLDLTDVYAGSAAGDGPTTVTVRVAAGVARVIVPDGADVVVRGEVRSGVVQVDGDSAGVGGGGSGWRLSTVSEPTGGTGPRLTVVLQVTDGAAQVVHG